MIAYQIQTKHDGEWRLLACEENGKVISQSEMVGLP